MLFSRPLRSRSWSLTWLLAFSACGGGDAPSGPLEPEAPTCDDGLLNGSETDLDCGGDECEPCAVGALCDAASDCESGECRARRCVLPQSCDDGVRNQGETGIDCGGPNCEPCGDEGPCDRRSDCDSGLCVAGRCAVPECGDGVTQAQNDEECDDRRESAECNADCTVAACGDGIVNRSAGEECEPTGSPQVWSRCQAGCTLGAGLDGTFGDEWEELAPPAGLIPSLQSFVYAGSRYIYEFYTNQRYDTQEDEWTDLLAEFPVPLSAFTANAAVSDDALFVPRGGKMHRFDLAEEAWSELKGDIPYGDDWLTAAVFDGEGNIWYHAQAGLIQYTPSNGQVREFAHQFFPLSETRFAYDPLTNRILFGGYTSHRFIIFDIATEKFTPGSENPAGAILDSTCQDRAGGVYTGSSDFTTMYRYDIATDTWKDLPTLPVHHDDFSSCVVSEDGYLYYGTSTPSFHRLPLGKR